MKYSFIFQVRVPQSDFFIFLGCYLRCVPKSSQNDAKLTPPVEFHSLNDPNNVLEWDEIASRYDEVLVSKADESY